VAALQEEEEAMTIVPKRFQFLYPMLTLCLSLTVLGFLLAAAFYQVTLLRDRQKPIPIPVGATSPDRSTSNQL
jgi:hypothetical protein